ncbi:hypothetical protein BUALT_Bualt15G0062600 [Buddleja alternifolia]|uniref:Uncharacterized protein n=1 Tax=Buddleja alternifolia TaxID=168488 RepID=A0AAV6WNW6_9LAMI|nr:hypothetical protein BUALT_Bualt15G0062600 [Buddleja alternifolia]
MFLVGDSKLWCLSRVSDDVAASRGRIDTRGGAEEGIEGTIPPLQFVLACIGVPAKVEAYGDDGLVEVWGSEIKQRGTGGKTGNLSRGDSKEKKTQDKKTPNENKGADDGANAAHFSGIRLVNTMQVLDGEDDADNRPHTTATGRDGGVAWAYLQLRRRWMKWASVVAAG